MHVIPGMDTSSTLWSVGSVLDASTFKETHTFLLYCPKKTEARRRSLCRPFSLGGAPNKHSWGPWWSVQLCEPPLLFQVQDFASRQYLDSYFSCAAAAETHQQCYVSEFQTYGDSNAQLR